MGQIKGAKCPVCGQVIYDTSVMSTSHFCEIKYRAKCPVCGQVIYDPLLAELKAGSEIDDFAHHLVNEVLDSLGKEIDTELFDEIKARVSLALIPEEDRDACRA